jgi:hypothetical protein
MSSYIPSHPVFCGLYCQDGRTAQISVAGKFDAPRGNCGVARDTTRATVSHEVLPCDLP